MDPDPLASFLPADRAAVPPFLPAQVVFPRPRVADVGMAVEDAVAGLLASRALPEGAEVGLTVGSRGISGIASIARAALDALGRRGMRPFVIPAMGSHGGATADGQRHLLAHYGITEETMGVEVRAAMATHALGRTAEGVEAFIAQSAWDADAVLLLNRVKPHTDFKGELESGLSKMCAIGLGKFDAAQECHSHVFGIGLGRAIRSAAGRVIESGKILGGIAIVENAYHETALIEPVPLDGFFAREEALLAEARRLMGRLPLDDIDVLICDRMGKNISGAGLDTNVIGRSVYGYIQGQAWQPDMPVVRRIIVRDLADESDGNAVGMGLVDFVSERFARKVNMEVTALNALTARSPENAKWPIVTKNDQESLRLALSIIPPRPEGPRIVYVRDTLELASLQVSEACAPLLASRPDVVLGDPAPLDFDAAGDVVSPFA
ncbi:MAG: lactate racemase domain-containing protein [Chloroflexota bacterium]|nr:lactate racemase domain-containing protein [Chloroflexota bacterium]